MKIFLTGASGFIGSNLIPMLEQHGHEVHAMQSDLLKFADVEREVLQHDPDIIVHLAARTEVESSFYEQTSFSSVNYVGTVNLIESACKQKNLPYFVFASTMEVYGWQAISDRVQQGEVPRDTDAFDENTLPHPNAPYAVAKYACELYLEYAQRTRGLDYCMLRQTNAFGRDNNNFFVTEQIIWQMLRNPKVIQLGYSTPYRNFIYVDDVVRAWVTAIESRDACRNQIFTLGPNQPRQIQEHADNIARQMGWNGQIRWNTRLERPGEIYYLCSRHDKFTTATGWRPQVSYEQGLVRTIEMWRNRPHA